MRASGSWALQQAEVATHSEPAVPKFPAFAARKTPNWGIWVFVALIGCASVVVGGLLALLDPLISLIVFLPLTFAVAVLYDYRVGVVLLAFLLPFSQSHFLPKFPGFNIIGYLSLATLASFGLRHLGRNSRLIKPPLWLLLFVLPVALATALGVSHIDEVPSYLVVTELFAHTTPGRYVKDLFLYPMLTVLWMLMLAQAASTSTQPRRYLWLLCGISALPALAVLASIGYLQTMGVSVTELASNSSGATRQLLSITGFHANEAGILLSSGFGPLLFATASAKTGQERLFLWTMLTLVALALLLTFSRGAYVSALICLALYIAQSKGKAHIKTLIVIAIAAMIAAMSGFLVSRVSQGWTEAASSDARMTAVTASRTNIWRALWPDVAARPILGNGLRSTAWSSAAKTQVIPTHPHNLYLEILLDMGVIGLVVLLLFFKRFTETLRRAANSLDACSMSTAYLAGAYASLVGYLVAAVANGHYTPAPENTLFWASLGIALAVIERERTRKAAVSSLNLAIAPPDTRKNVAGFRGIRYGSR